METPDTQTVLPGAPECSVFSGAPSARSIEDRAQCGLPGRFELCPPSSPRTRVNSSTARGVCLTPSGARRNVCRCPLRHSRHRPVGLRLPQCRRPTAGRLPRLSRPGVSRGDASGRRGCATYGMRSGGRDSR